MHRIAIDLYFFIACVRNGIGVFYRIPSCFFSSQACFDDVGCVFVVAVCDRDRFSDRESVAKSTARKTISK